MRWYWNVCSQAKKNFAITLTQTNTPPDFFHDRPAEVCFFVRFVLYFDGLETHPSAPVVRQSWEVELPMEIVTHHTRYAGLKDKKNFMHKILIF